MDTVMVMKMAKIVNMIMMILRSYAKEELVPTTAAGVGQNSLPCPGEGEDFCLRHASEYLKKK
jgi:hypothetical protein